MTEQSRYSFEDYDKFSCLKPNADMWLVIVYLVHSFVLFIVSLVTQFRMRGGAGEVGYLGAMHPVSVLSAVLAAFQSVFGRSRLMRLAADAVVPPHSETRHHWPTYVRIRIPIVTDPDVLLNCNRRHARMAAGEARIFDAWKTHRVQNRSSRDRVLVADIRVRSRVCEACFGRVAVLRGSDLGAAKAGVGLRPICPSDL